MLSAYLLGLVGSLRGTHGRRCWKVPPLASHLEPGVGIVLSADLFSAQEPAHKSLGICLAGFMSENSHLAELVHIASLLSLPSSGLLNVELTLSGMREPGPFLSFSHFSCILKTQFAYLYSPKNQTA